MNKRRLPWLLSIALIGLGSVAAHSLGYLAFARAGERGGEVAEGSHGLESHLPLLLAMLGAAVAVGVLSRIVSAARGRPAGDASVRWFVLLPPLGFALQEAIERVLHVESFPWNGMHEPAFLAALLLQIPFGIVAFVAALWLTRVAVGIGRLLAGGELRPRRIAAALIRPADVLHPRRYRVGGHDSLQRAPPRRGLVHLPLVVAAN